MQILGLVIPRELQKNSFVCSLAGQAQRKGKLSQKQHASLLNILDIDLDFYGCNFEPEDDDPYRDDFYELLKKHRANRFRKSKRRNICILAMESIINCRPDDNLIEDILRTVWTGNYRR